MTSYTFDNSAEDAVDQLDSLQAFLDPITETRLTGLRPWPGARCWEIGAGGGSIAAFLARHVGPAGHVVATDIDTSRLGHLRALDNVTVATHDVTTLTPPDEAGGSFDLIHARLVLLHLPQRHEILKTLVGLLAPGGWLLLEEFDCTQPLRVYTSRSVEDAELFARVTGAIIAVLEANGADMGWASDLHATMVNAGLHHVQTITHSQSWTGGGSGARLHATNARQLATQLQQRGITPDDLDRFETLMADPGHAASSYQVVSTCGQNPARRGHG